MKTRFAFFQYISIAFAIFSTIIFCYRHAKATKNDPPLIIYCVGNQDSTGSCTQEESPMAENQNPINCTITSWPFVKCDSQTSSGTKNYNCFALSNTNSHNQISLSCQISMDNHDEKSLSKTLPDEEQDSTTMAEDKNTIDITEEPVVLQSPFNQSLTKEELRKEIPQDFDKAFN